MLPVLSRMSSDERKARLSAGSYGTLWIGRIEVLDAFCMTDKVVLQG